MLNGKRINISPKIRHEGIMAIFQLLNIGLEVQPSVISQEIQIKVTKNRKEIKLSFIHRQHNCFSRKYEEI